MTFSMARIVTAKTEPITMFLNCRLEDFLSKPLINRNIKYRRIMVIITTNGLTLPDSVENMKIIINKAREVKPIKQ